MVNQAHIRVWGGGIASGWAVEAVERDRGAQGKPCSTRNRHGGCGRINIELVENFGISHLLLLPTTTRQGEMGCYCTLRPERGEAAGLVKEMVWWGFKEVWKLDKDMLPNACMNQI
jgi:hypothetical protein